ncbi:MAG: nitroreductase family protein [Candidatus Thorarchaeota archaeon]|jgi:nitroreductase
MDIPVNSWYEAVFLRHSHRQYSGEIPRDEVTDRIERVCNDFRPFPAARAVLVRDSGKDVFKGAVGEFFYKVKETPSYITFVGNMETPNVQAITGYLGEGIILEATALGLNTCWVGGFYRRESVMKHIDLEEGERILGITPIGYSREEADRVGVSSKQYRRKDLEKLVLRGDIDTNTWVRTALEAVRVAPSAANRQPWRFEIGDDSITVSSDSKREGLGVSRKLDCGIAMLHLELGARSHGVRGNWEFIDYPRVARYRID